MNRTIGSALAGHANALGFIRLVLASAVIFSHAKPLGGLGRDPLLGVTHGQANLGSIAVAGFFAISGYVIVRSGMSSDGLQFLWRRVIRIFPAYWAVLLVTAIVLAPLMTIRAGGSLPDLFSAPDGPLHYIQANWTLTVGAWGIGDIYTANTPYGQAVGYSAINGSIWTLAYEWVCYMLVLVLIVFGVLKKAKPVIPALTGLFFILQVLALTNTASLGSIAPFFGDIHRVELTFIFLLGATIGAYADRVPFSDALGIFAGLLVVGTLAYGGYTTIGLVAGAYFVLYLGVRLPRPLQVVGSRHDYSYGVYIYGFVVQQTVASFGAYKLGYLPFALISLIIALACAWLSWHVIERPALMLKNWGPGRGFAYWSEWSRAAVAPVGARVTAIWARFERKPKETWAEAIPITSPIALPKPTE